MGFELWKAEETFEGIFISKAFNKEATDHPAVALSRLEPRIVVASHAPGHCQRISRAGPASKPSASWRTCHAMTLTAPVPQAHRFIPATLEEVMHALYEGSDGNTSSASACGDQRSTIPMKRCRTSTLRFSFVILMRCCRRSSARRMMRRSTCSRTPEASTRSRNGKVWREYEHHGAIPYEGKAIYYVAGNDHVASLNAVVIDLDVGKGQVRHGELLTADRTMMILWDRVESGALPRPHFIAKSGRGVYIVYLLGADEEGPRRPVPNEVKARTITSASNRN